MNRMTTRIGLLPPAAFIAVISLSACSAPAPVPGSEKGAAASADFRDGRLADAESGWERALAEDRFAVNVPDAVRHLNNLGSMALYDGRLEAAGARFAEALDLCVLDDLREARGRLQLQLACVKLRLEDLAGAEGLLEESRAWSDDAGGSDRAQWRSLKAGLALRRGDTAAAAASARGAHDDAENAEERAAASVLLGRALEAEPVA
ncbi:MAG: hypothetical protein FD180_4618, partial [Planctomycetota bacterium]